MSTAILLSTAWMLGWSGKQSTPSISWFIIVLPFQWPHDWGNRHFETGPNTVGCVFYHFIIHFFIYTGWWFQTFFMFHVIYGILLPIDELIFFKIAKTTNQIFINDYQPQPLLTIINHYLPLFTIINHPKLYPLTSHRNLLAVLWVMRPSQLPVSVAGRWLLEQDIWDWMTSGRNGSGKAIGSTIPITILMGHL